MTLTAPIRAFAPAKINLALHITGQRDDGYHLLESLVMFAKVGDWLTIELAPIDGLTFSGPFGHTLRADTATNLVLKARDAMRQVGRAKSLPCPPVLIHLEKNLPLSSGIGGGSADAAATMKVLNELWLLGLSETELKALGLPLGADVPMCIVGEPLIASGIGETIMPLNGLRNLPIVLVNPGVGVSTPAIFKSLVSKKNQGLAALSPTILENNVKFLEYLRSTRNDLQDPAIALCPQISQVLDLLMASGSLFARMSGSGATCFGLFESEQAARMAASGIADNHKNWWVA